MSLQADPRLRATYGVPGSLQTLWWRAPEVLFGSQTFDQAIDLWSLGLVLAEMGDGSRFQARGASKMITRRPSSSSLEPQTTWR